MSKFIIDAKSMIRNALRDVSAPPATAAAFRTSSARTINDASKNSHATHIDERHSLNNINNTSQEISLLPLKHAIVKYKLSILRRQLSDCIKVVTTAKAGARGM